jgi:hypothetical protein
MAELVNTFSWSHSRRGCFEACLRQYWLCYYGSWGGWERDAAPAVREAYVQKKLTTRALWIGTVVHDLAEAALSDLQAGRRPDPAWHQRRALERARRDLADSAAGRWRAQPSRVCAFQEHYYGVDVPAEVWEEALAVIAQQAASFFGDPVVRRLHQVPERLIEVEKLAQVAVGGVPVWVKLDALVADGRGGAVVVDWKTGAGHQDEVIAAQLGVYGLYCTLVHGFPPDRIVAMQVNLRHGERTQHPVDAEVQAHTREQIQASAADMRARLVDPEGNRAREEDFPGLPEGDPACGSCAYRRSCGRG